MLEKIKKYRQDLHQIPELELDLPQTKAYVVNILKDLDCILEYPIESSVAAFFNNHKEKTLAFRSDMDALPIQEQNHTDYVSKYPGKMHACGHDGHMAMLLGFAQELNTYYKELDTNILLIFQPGEENPGGAKKICETGILEKYNVQYIFGFHVWPYLKEGQIATKPGSMMARSSEVNIEIFGKSSHAAKYKEGIDSLEIAANYLVDIYNMEKQIDDSKYRLLRFGKMESGTIRNIVSDYARLEGTMRACDDETFFYMKDQLEQLSKKHKATFTFDINEGYPALVNDEELVNNILNQRKDIIRLKEPELITEDFSYYLQYVPGAFFYLGTGTGIPLHNDHFDFDEKILLEGIQMYIYLSKNVKV